MRKFCAFIFTVSYLAMTASIHAATSNFDFDGLKLKCESKFQKVTSCKNGKKEIIVILTNSQYIVYDQFDPPRAKIANKVLKDGKLVHQKNTNNKVDETQEMQRLFATLLFNETKGLQDTSLKKINQQTSDFLNRTPEYIDNLNVVLNNKETLNCTKGEGQKNRPDKKDCSYYSCTGKDPKEKILFYMPPVGSILVGPSVLAMKDGQARYYDNEFTVLDKSNSIVSLVKKNNYQQHDYNPALYPQNNNVNPDLLLPTKYNASKTSYDYLQRFAVGDQDEFGLKSLCKENDVNKLFNEQKKIATEMKDYLVYADIVSYLSAINGDVNSFYIDKTKAQKMGCIFQDKVIDTSALPELQRIESISGIKVQKKYPSVAEVQGLFKKAQQMRDVPFEYKYDGCFARAHIMARRFENMGMTVKKAWIRGDLRIPNTDIRWGYHVAPLIEAKDSKGNIVQYVLDPSVTDKAVTLDEWAAMMDKGEGKRVMKTTYPMAENGLDFGRTVLAVSSSDPYGPSDMKNITEVEKMQNAREVLDEFSLVLEEKARGGR